MGDPAAPAPRDITSWFVGQLISNGKVAIGQRPGIGAALIGLGGLLVDKAVTLRWFKKQVQNGGPWDFKNNALKADKAAGVMFAGTHYRNDMPGNFHYGYVGIMAGIGADTLEAAAGAAQLSAGTSKPEYWCASFDDPEDNMYLRLGIALAQTKGLKLTAADVDAMLKKFVHFTCAPPPRVAKMVINQLF
jgi:hypothetical protein